MVSFADTICMPSPALGIERDDNKFSTYSLPNPAAVLAGQNWPHCPERDYLIRFPHGHWSGKSLARPEDFGHIPGWSGRSWPSPQDMKAIQSMAETHAEFAAHIPNLREAEDLLEGRMCHDPYTHNGSRHAGRDEGYKMNLPSLYETMKKRGVRNEELVNLGLKVTALDIRKARVQKQAEALRLTREDVYRKKEMSEDVMTHLPGASERFKWQTPLIPKHPLSTTTRMIAVASRDK